MRNDTGMRAVKSLRIISGGSVVIEEAFDNSYPVQ